MITLAAVYIALCGIATGITYARGIYGIACALAAVLGCAVGGVGHGALLWHVFAPAACLAGVLWTCRGGYLPHVLHGTLAAALGLTLGAPALGRVGVGYYLAACHLVAFVWGLWAYRSRDALTSPLAARLSGLTTASCAAGCVGAVLWAHGLTTAPATVVDVALLGALVVVAR